MNSLAARVEVDLPGFILNAELGVQNGGTVALLGPNGSGKSTFVRAVAGLIDVREGEIVVDGLPWLRRPGGIDVAPQDRSIGVVFQDLALFPDMSAVDNIAYGPRSRGMARRDADSEAARWLGRLGADRLADRRAGSLSGGEAQKVALARALILEPQVLLLDEPMSALDVESRADARHLLASILREVGGVKVLVTHSPIDAFAVADTLAIMEEGRIVQVGSAPEISIRPRSRYSAKVAGVNLLRGTLDVRHGSSVLCIDDAELFVAVEGIPNKSDVFATFPASAIVLATERPTGSARNTFQVTVVRVEKSDGRARVALEGSIPVTAEVTLQSVEGLGVRPGARLWAAIKATEIEVYRA